eukprot:CAMPEP_0198224262 /NCGR_PEP_ID=MMETSP1445-20131203/96102_1 /TAXON_ID=36898 /ORGANISM="Pyramimonas sp., Strain CCMP2087" /LENGTH=77 /DNA_ID=CAMNT_0043903363 /DNA_START=48 /DNA_END=277 /DNA_ORIENTATION=-
MCAPVSNALTAGKYSSIMVKNVKGELNPGIIDKSPVQMLEGKEGLEMKPVAPSRREANLQPSAPKVTYAPKVTKEVA